ncbi:unnamed protein product [Lampetra fluviatilis]
MAAKGEDLPKGVSTEGDGANKSGSEQQLLLGSSSPPPRAAARTPGRVACQRSTITARRRSWDLVSGRVKSLTLNIVPRATLLS